MDIKRIFEIKASAIAILDRVSKRQKELPDYSAKKPSEKTIDGYQKVYRRLEEDTDSIANIIAKAKDTRSANTWNCRRAALIFCSQEKITKMLENKFNPFLSKPSENDIDNFIHYVNLLDAIDKEPPISKKCRRPAHSKKKDLRGLPDDWMEQICNRMPKYELQILTLAITGCRPSELANGVELHVIDGKLHAVIKGTKVTKNSGQPIRELIFTLQKGLVWKLVELVHEYEDFLIVGVKNRGNLTTAIRAAGKRTFPKLKSDITAYCFRHQVTANWKAYAKGSNDPKAELLKISAALGHLSDQTKRYYGHYMQARSGSAIPVDVITARPVKQKKTINYASLKKRKRLK